MMLLHAAERHGRVALRHEVDGGWREVSYSEAGRIVRRLARGLIALGVEPGDRVAILSDTRVEWTLADVGGLCAGAVVVPVYHTSTPEDIRHVLADSGARVVFCEDTRQLSKVREVWDGTDIEHAILFESDRDHGEGDVVALDDLCGRADEVEEGEIERRLHGISGDDLVTIVYTSDGTGPPEGCKLTHANYRADLDAIKELMELGEDSVVFVFLPLAHALTRVTQLLAMHLGGTLAYSKRDKQERIDDLPEMSPTHLENSGLDTAAGPALRLGVELVEDPRSSREMGAVGVA